MANERSEALIDWINLYDRTVEDVWISQSKQFRKAAMILKILDNELKRIYHAAQQDFLLCQQEVDKICEKSALKQETVTNKISSDEKENAVIRHSSPSKIHFQELGVLNDSSNVEDVAVIYSSDEDLSNKTCTSPKINKFDKLSKIKRLRHSVNNYSSLELNHSTPPKVRKVLDIIDSTIIDTTPEVANISRKLKNSVHIEKFKKRRNVKNTITQMFADLSESKEEQCSNTDSTYVPDEVRMHSRTEETVKKNKTPKKLIRPELVYKESPVRGKARLKLEGWECDECKKFYDCLDLKPEERKNLLNKCSRHRSKFKPHDYTPKGFWNLDFSPSQSPEKSTGDSTYFQY